ncbi:blast:GTP-binding nuclear protein Ran [Drosophila guanche]|uniref:Blast:GTP-binding nuclear protein Ran n=1 Tax=Drosophila guanche TaxID=7266 RepID=A0A3B0JZ55_DROGU|nr:blast:GTP-binding nuclear protein Ran [Drosophila guanche]
MLGRKRHMPTYKCAIIGPKGSGKSSFIQRHLTGAFDQGYYPTVGVVVIKLMFNTSRGPICFEMWEGETVECNEAPNIVLKQIKCAILMFDEGIQEPFINFSTYYSLLDLVPSHVMTSICCNKTDIKTCKNNPLRLTIYRCTKISCKTNLNLEKPFEYFARKLFKDQTLVIVPRTPLLPAQVKLSGEDLLGKKEWASKASTEDYDKALPKSIQR